MGKEHCEMCGKVFIGKGYLKHHIKSVHEGKSLDLKCTHPGCEEIFKNSASRSRHFYIVHHPNKYRCETCNKSFGHKTSLQKHLVTHTGERSVPCPDCDRKFATKSVLRDHQRSAHTGEKPFACPHCPYRGSSSSLLYHHKKQVHRAEFETEKKRKELGNAGISLPGGEDYTKSTSTDSIQTTSSEVSEEPKYAT